MQVRQCKGKTQTGKPCGMAPILGSNYCFSHSVRHRKAQALARKLGGLNRRTPHYGDASKLPATITTLGDATKILEYALAEVKGMENSLERARVLLALFEAFAKAIEIGSMEDRISALERTAIRS